MANKSVSAKLDDVLKAIEELNKRMDKFDQLFEKLYMLNWTWDKA